MTKKQLSTNNSKIIRKLPLLGRKRALFQWLTSLLIIGIPFIHYRGKSLLRLDFRDQTLYAFGQDFPITDLSLFLLFGIALTLLFLLTTIAIGRAWCGWACPQTTLVDFVEWLARQIGIKIKAGQMIARTWQKVVMQLVYLAVAILVGANLVWYFVSPYEFFRALLDNSLHWSVLLTLSVVAITIYLDLALLRRLFCKEFCPYGRFQTVLIDSGTLTLQYHPDESHRCIQCNACVRSCPTGIDIRRGFQIECINCGRCLDACREIMAKHNQKGIIRYTFGLDGKGPKALLNIRVALVSLSLFCVTSALLLIATSRDEISLKIARNINLLPRKTSNQRIANFYSAYLTNRQNNALFIHLDLEDKEGDLELFGATSGQLLRPHEKKRFDFSITAPTQSLAKTRTTDILVKSDSEKTLARVTIYLTKPLNDDH